MFVNGETQAVAGPVWQAGKTIIRPKAVALEHGARRVVETFTWCSDYCGVEDRLLCFPFQVPDAGDL